MTSANIGIDHQAKGTYTEGPKGELIMDDNKLSIFTTPPSFRGVPSWLVYITGVLGFIYMLNPTAGFIEFIPDNIPLVGNLDEGVAFLLVWYGILEFFEGSKWREE